MITLLYLLKPCFQFYNDPTNNNKEIVKLMASVVRKVWNSMKTITSFLLKDFRIRKLCFLVLTSYLLYEELYVLLFVKPTLTSVTQTKIKVEQFPDVLICPEQLKLLSRLGYTRSLNYGLGQADC